MARTSQALSRLIRRKSEVVAAPAPEPVVVSGSSNREVTLRWVTVDATRTAEHPDLIGELLAKRIDGMMIKGVFTPAEVERALARLADIHDGWTPEPFGAMLGMPLNQLGDNATTRVPYIEDGERCRPVYAEIFGFDPHQRIASVLEPMAGGRALIPPEENGRAYNPGNIRIYEPGRGGLRAHVGNEFIEVSAPGAMNHLLTTTRTRDHMSYFTVLQPSEAGGGLSVYDLLFVDHPTHERRWDGEYRDDAWFDNFPHMLLEPGPGDMILFGGGWRWHRVDPIEGTIPRITYGGFASPALTGSAVHFWC